MYNIKKLTKVLFLVFFILISLKATAKTITVCQTCSIKTIQNAIDLAENGDSVIVKSGIYKETIINFNKSIHLVGENYPIIDAEGKTESIFAVEANDFSISGFKLINVGMSYTKEIAGFFVSHSKNFTIKDCIFDNDFYAFILQKVNYGLIQGNKIKGEGVDETNSGNGIHIWKSKNMRIEQNTVEGMRDGIYLEFVENSFFSNNTSKNNIRYGMHFMFSHHDEYHHNEFKNNGAGVAVMFSKFIKMHHNTFHFNWGTASYGLLLKEINDATIENNYGRNFIVLSIVFYWFVIRHRLIRNIGCYIVKIFSMVYLGYVLLIFPCCPYLKDIIGHFNILKKANTYNISCYEN